MPQVNLGTCCGSLPTVGLNPWLDAGGNGVDTAYDYGKLCPGGKQSDIAEIFETRQTKRTDVFITTKIPAGLGVTPGDCLTATADTTVKHAINQCEMSVASYSAGDIAYTQSQNITYEAYNAMKGCPFSDPSAQKIAAGHSVSVAQVCLRWIIQKGAVMAVGTGQNASTVGEYAKSDLDIFGFELTDDEMATLGSIK